MFNYIEKLRQKSEKEKKRVALLYAFLFAGVIFVIWLSVVYPDFRKEKTVGVEIEERSGPTGAIKENIISGFNNIKGEFFNMKEVIYNLSREEVYYSSTSSQNGE